MLTKAVLAAVEQAMALIRADPREAALTYIAAERATMPVELVERLLKNPDYAFTPEPLRVMKYVEFMGRTGQMKNAPKDWRELFLPLIHDRQGS